MKKWLFSPFELIAGWSALAAGLVVILVTALIACAGGIHLDGVLDLHVTKDISLLTSLLEGLINWLSLSAFTYLAGLIFSRSSIRIIDVLGTQALARFPFLIACLVTRLCFNDNILHYLEYTYMQKGEPVSVTALDWVLFALMLLATLATTVWAVVLMYRAYSVSCNVKGSRGMLSFTGSLLFAEIISKVLISFII